MTTVPCGATGTQLTDAQWAQIEALLPPRPHRRGRPRADDRRTLEAILYVQRTGCAWSDLPAELGDEATAHRRWQEWQAAGLWERLPASGSLHRVATTATDSFGRYQFVRAPDTNRVWYATSGGASRQLTANITTTTAISVTPSVRMVTTLVESSCGVAL